MTLNAWTRRSFLKVLLAPPIAGIIGLEPRLAASAKVTATGVTVPLPRYTAQIIFAGNFLVATPRMSRCLYGITE